MTSSNSTKRLLRGISRLITIKRNSTKPLYQQIYDGYRAGIMRGDLRGGDAVPSTRELARELRISRLPVLNAYSQLVAEGHFESRAGSGTFIAAGISTRPRFSEWLPGRDIRRRSISTRAKALPKFEKPVWVGLGAFQVGQPELNSFPVHIWSRILSRSSRELKVDALQYGNPMGLPELREILATYLRTSRGVRCEPEQIMIVSGSQQALDIATRVLLDPGAPTWVEEPGYWLAKHVLQAGGCRAVPVPVDWEGLNVAAGIKLQRNARAAFVTPSHQYPLGVTMSATRRFELLKWADEASSWIIEDDYDSEFRYDTMPIASLQGLDTNARVIYTGTFSKVLFPSIRLGYIVIPFDLVDRFAAVRQAMDICPSNSSQIIVAKFIREGHFSRHIRKMRRLYEERRRVLIEELQSQLGSSCKILGASAGMHLTLLHSDKLRDCEIAAKALKQNLLLSALSLSYIGPSPRKGFVLGFGNTPVRQIPGAVLLLKNLLSA